MNNKKRPLTIHKRSLVTYKTSTLLWRSFQNKNNLL
nr:MAG TPA: hypothetical protein [Caudoviricetes sp.]